MTPSRASVLVVDDDVDICRNVSDILTDLDYHVDTAHNGPSALDLVRQRPYDLALLDLKMPGMDGLTLYRELRKLRAETVAIVVTAFAGPETASEALDAGAWKVLPKPVDFPRLLRLAEEALEQPLVLIVEDDPLLCAELWRRLRERGFRVALAADGRAAIERLEGRAFRVVLIDLKVPEGDPTAIIRQIREASPEARTLLITSGESDGAVVGAIAEGADAVCYKPFDVPALLGIVERLAGPEAGGEGHGQG